MRNKIFAFLMTFASISWMVIACQSDEPIVGDGSQTVEVETSTTAQTYSLTPDAASVACGESIQLSVVSSTGSAVTGATWSSSNTSVATVDQNGNVVAVANGTATITATIGGVAATSTLTVTNGQISATGVTVSPVSVSSTVGQTVQLSASITPTNATGVTYTWSSSNTSVATVNQAGLVTLVGSGTAVITVTTNSGLYAASTITAAAATSTTTTYTVNSSSCIGCGKCLSACPNGAISISGRKAYIDQSKCTACGKCISRCGHGAIVKTTTSNVIGVTN